MIEEAAKDLNVKPDELKPFFTEDPFNLGNSLEGYLCRRSDYRYGALWIETVNNCPLPKPEIVYCTPKLHYPFGRTDSEDRNYNFPEFSEGYAYEKIDGTNICCYSYPDATGQRYVTFKTRLTPVLHQSFYGDFLGMWNEILDRHQALRTPPLVLLGKVALSYEMFGYRNPITIAYDVDWLCPFIRFFGRIYGQRGE